MDIKEIKVVMLPWLAHGHISPFMELAKRLTKRGFLIYICSTPANLKSIKNKVADHIQLVELHLPSLSDLPPHHHTTNGLPPHLLQTLQHAFGMAGPQFSEILSHLNPDLVIYDYQPWAAGVASSLGIPAVQFLTVGAAMLLHVIYAFEKPGKNFPFQEISLTEDERVKFFGHDPSGDSNEFLEAFRRSQDIVLIKTCGEMEEKYVDFLSDVSKKRMVPVGPLVQDLEIDDGSPEIMQWLGKKEEKSVVFVSFGSEYFLSKEERYEVAKGLEISEVNFIWVIRFSNEEEMVKIEEAFPKGFLDSIGNRGLIVEGWAPQARILGHASTGGFVSHCGWSSILESINFGVPIVAMPMQIDQPINARLVEAIRAGAEVVKDENGRFQHEEIAKVIKKIVMDDNGEDIRKNVRQISEKFRVKMDDEMDKVMEQLTRLSKIKKRV